MQIETTVDKAAILRLGYYLGGGGIAEQQIDRAARDSIGTALSTIAGVRLVEGGGFALTPASVGQQTVSMDLAIDHLTRAVHKLRNGQWPALSDVQLDVVAELTNEVDAWIKEAQAEETWERLPKEARDRISGIDKEKHG